jgi:hypothetical protein
MLKEFDDETKKVTEQLLLREIKPRHRADARGALRREWVVAFKTVADANSTEKASRK